MKHDVSGFYLLQDGTMADPDDCEHGKDGVLRTKSGMVVTLNGEGNPQTIGEANQSNKMAADAGKPEEKPAAEDNHQHDVDAPQLVADADQQPSVEASTENPQ